MYKLSWLVLAAVLSITLLPDDAALGSDPRPTDQQMELRIGEALQQESGVTEATGSGTLPKLSWTVSAGVVTLKGQVASYAERHRIEQLCKEVTGVVKIDNRISVEPSVIADIKAAPSPTGSETGSIAEHADTSESRSGIKANGGDAAHPHKRSTNTTVVKAIEEELAFLFRDSGPLAEFAIQFEVLEGGQVHLQGVVDRMIYKRLVREVVRSVPGVCNVNAQQLVLSRAQESAEAEQDAATPALDNIAVVRMALGVVRRPVTEQINVLQVDQQWILQGTVQSLSRQQQLARLAKALSRDTKISNQIVVRPIPRDDQAMQSELQQLIANASSLNVTNLQVRVANAHATIVGKVPDFNTKMRLMRMVSTVEGLAGLSNQTTVAWSPQFSDDGLRRALTKRMEKAGIEGITIHVAQGVATLSGALSNTDAETARQVAELTDGVREVLFAMQVAEM